MRPRVELRRRHRRRGARAQVHALHGAAAGPLRHQGHREEQPDEAARARPAAEPERVAQQPDRGLEAARDALQVEPPHRPARAGVRPTAVQARETADAQIYQRRLHRHGHRRHGPQAPLPARDARHLQRPRHRGRPGVVAPETRARAPRGAAARRPRRPRHHGRGLHDDARHGPHEPALLHERHGDVRRPDPDQAARAAQGHPRALPLALHGRHPGRQERLAAAARDAAAAREAAPLAAHELRRRHRRRPGGHGAAHHPDEAADEPAEPGLPLARRRHPPGPDEAGL